jgi:guanylate kinase
VRAEDYTASPEVLEKLKQVDFVGLVGPTAAGKSTLIHAAVAAEPAQFKEVLVTSSRALRPGERQDKDMHFRSKAAMLAGIKARRFVQIMVHPSGDIYATAGEDYPGPGVTALMPVLAAVIPVFRAQPFKRFRLVYVLPPDIGTWLERIETHGFTLQQRAQRFEEAKASIRIALDTPDMLFMVSETPEQAVADLQELLGGTYDPAIQDGLWDHAACLLAQIY